MKVQASFSKGWYTAHKSVLRSGWHHSLLYKILTGEDKNDLVEQGQRDLDLELPDQWSSLELPGGRLKHRHQEGGLSALAFDSQSSKQDQAGKAAGDLLPA